MFQLEYRAMTIVLKNNESIIEIYLAFRLIWSVTGMNVVIHVDGVLKFTA